REAGVVAGEDFGRHPGMHVAGDVKRLWGFAAGDVLGVAARGNESVAAQGLSLRHNIRVVPDRIAILEDDNLTGAKCEHVRHEYAALLVEYDVFLFGGRI